MCCDFRLTDPFTRKVVDNEAHKLVSASTRHGYALIGVTGIAFLGGMPVGDWIANTTGKLGQFVPIEEVCAELKNAEKILATLKGAQDRRLTFMVGTFVGSQALLAIVSNFEKFTNGKIVRTNSAEAVMTISKLKPKSPAFFATGDADSIQRPEQDQLVLALRSGATDDQIQEKLRAINEAVSARTNTVSSGCYASSLHVTGAGSGQPFLTDEQKGDFIPRDFAYTLKQLGLQLNPAIGPDGKPMPIRMRQSATGRSGGSREYFREQLKLQPENAEVWNNYGSYLMSLGNRREGLEAFEKALMIDPGYWVAAANVAKQVWRQQGNVQRADRLYGEALAAQEPSPPSWLLIDFAILCAEALSDIDKAAEFHQRASADVNNPVALAHEALFILRYKTDKQGAAELLKSALQRQPDNSLILALAGQADFFYFGNTEAALDKLHKASSLAPNEGFILRLTADVCASAGDSASAVYYYRKAIAREEYSAETHGNYGLALLMERKLSGALQHLTGAAKSDSQNLAIQANLAAALWVSGKKAEAIQRMQGITDDPGVPPGINLETLAMLCIATPSAKLELYLKLRQLIDDGARANGNTVRCMTRDRSRDERDLGEKIARVIEGKEAFPSDW
jgi:tetratricopeptide (TPR) repeat protein